MNLIIFSGRVGNDAVVRRLDNGTSIISFSIAHTEKFTQNGETKEKTTWVQCSWWKKADQSTTVYQYIKKGGYVVVTGSASVSSFQGRDGNPSASLEIRVTSLELGGSKGDNAGTSTAAPPSFASDQYKQPEGSEDGLPF